MSAYDMDFQYRRWLIKAPLGLLLTGFGACLIGEATVAKASGSSTARWVAGGTIALTVLNGGLSLLADASKHRNHFVRMRDAPTGTDRAST